MHNYWWLLIAAFLLLLAVFTMRKEYTMRKNGVRTNGLIIDVLKERDGEGSVLYRPIVQFSTLNGQPIIWRCTSASSFWRNARGKGMRLIYDPQNPQRVIRNHWTGYAAIVILLVIAAVIIGAFFLGA